MPRNTLNGTRTTFCDSGKHDRLVHGLARRFGRARKGVAEHHGVAAEEQRLDDGAVALDAAVGDERNPVAHRHAALDERVKLRHAEVRVEPCGAAAARADADLDAVDAALGEIRRAVRGGDVAGDELEIAEPGAKRLERFRHDDRVAVRDVDDEHVDAGLDQLGGALEIVPFRADRRAHAKPPLRVARGQREPFLLDDVLGGDEPDQHAVRYRRGAAS